MIKIVALGVFTGVFLLLCYIRYGTGAVAEPELPQAGNQDSPQKVLYVDNQTVVFVTGESHDSDSAAIQVSKPDLQLKK